MRLDRADLTAVDETPGGFSISARGHGDAQGRLTLLFRSDPVELRGWTLVDAQGRETRVRFGALSPAEHLAAGPSTPATHATDCDVSATHKRPQLGS